MPHNRLKQRKITRWASPKSALIFRCLKRYGANDLQVVINE
jgi:hypothetical protein